MRTRVIILLILAAFLALSAGSGQAANPKIPQEQSGGVYSLTWNTIAGGGFTQGGIFTLDGAIGQYEAGTTMGANPYTLTGGFYVGFDKTRVFIPAIQKP